MTRDDPPLEPKPNPSEPLPIEFTDLEQGPDDAPALYRDVLNCRVYLKTIGGSNADIASSSR